MPTKVDHMQWRDLPAALEHICVQEAEIERLQSQWEKLRGIVRTNATGHTGGDINDWDVMEAWMGDIETEDIEMCARCGTAPVYEDYAWCLQCRPGLAKRDGESRHPEYFAEPMGREFGGPEDGYDKEESE